MRTATDCFYGMYYGERSPNSPYMYWEGMQDATRQGDRIGMLINVDQGSMTFLKNDVRLGVM